MRESRDQPAERLRAVRLPEAATMRSSAAAPRRRRRERSEALGGPSSWTGSILRARREPRRPSLPGAAAMDVSASWGWDLIWRRRGTRIYGFFRHLLEMPQDERSRMITLLCDRAPGLARIARHPASDRSR